MPAKNNQTRLVTHNGRTLTILQWSQETGISQQTILSRLGPRPVARSEYARLIKAACQAVGVAPWHPHQLRHNKATEVKRLYESDEAAARAIGTSEDVAARIYADPQEAVDRRIAREAG